LHFVKKRKSLSRNARAIPFIICASSGRWRHRADFDSRDQDGLQMHSVTAAPMAVADVVPGVSGAGDAAMSRERDDRK
jgi:hypothetical protein